MIILIDNYDSFTWNLVQMCSGKGHEIRVIRNDEMTPEQIESLHPDGLILSPGPGRPEDAGILMDAIKHFRHSIPILGVCLGHQALCAAEGMPVIHAKQLMHGKTSLASIDPDCALFKGISNPMQIGRYHSLAADGSHPADSLQITCQSDDQEIMGVQLCGYPVYGIQFHPESILTPEGEKLLDNFLSIVKENSND